MKPNRLYFLLFFFLINGIILAQSSVKILDLGVEPQENISQTSDVQIEIFFKINQIDIAQNVLVDFGTVQNGNDIASFTAQVIPNGTGYALSYNGNTFPVNESTYKAKFIVSLTQQQYHDLSCITLKVQDNTGQFSNILTLGNN
ncbi:MAG: hypothetical protein JXR90_14175 [Spirochaetes bacterium]|nr:hypothetical protein [Spirochaetota bacterium]